MPGTLYVVATPIGNLQDLSDRARETLQAVDLIACEDTRHSGRLLAHLQISTPTVSYHDHNEEERAAELIGRLEAGDNVAVISDAGTPLIADPGYRLVRSCRQAGVPVVPIPGPSAVTVALSASGLPTDRYLFAGFLPRKPGGARKLLQELKPVQATLVFFLSPHRLDDSLRWIAETLGDREAFLAREMTKLHEESWQGRLTQLRQSIESERIRGEFTLVVAGGAGPTPLELNAEAYVAGLVALGETRKSAIQQASRELGISRNELYRKVVGRE